MRFLAADLVFADGIVEPDAFVLDTDRIRVVGDGRIDLGTGGIAFKVRPRPKSPQYFSLATPVQVTGTITQPHVGITGSGFLSSLARFFGSIVTVSWQRIAGADQDLDRYMAEFVFQDGTLTMPQTAPTPDTP